MAQNTYSKNKGRQSTFNRGYETYPGPDYIPLDDQNFDVIADEYEALGLEYPIGDGQGIMRDPYAYDYNSDEESPPNFRLNKNFVPMQDKSKIPTEKSKVYQTNVNGYHHSTRRSRNSLNHFQQRPNRYSGNDIGDYVDYKPLPKNRSYYGKNEIARRSTLAYPGKYSCDPHSKYRQDCLFQRMYEAQVGQATIDKAQKRYTAYAPELENLSHEQLKNFFIDQYEIDRRKQNPLRSVRIPGFYEDILRPKSREARNKKNTQLKVQERRPEKARAVNENCDILQKSTNLARSAPKNERHLDSNQEANEEQPQSLDKNGPSETDKIYDPYSNSFAYKELFDCKIARNIEKQLPEETELEVKYRNNDFQGNDILKDHLSPHKDGSYQGSIDQSSVCESAATNVKNNPNSYEKLSLPNEHSSCKVKNSARSGHSKISAISNSKRYTELVNLERSKCKTLSVIDDGLHKIEQSRNEVLGTPKSRHSIRIRNESSHVQTHESKDKSLSCRCLDMVRSEFINNMFKECRDYHFENIKQEVRRLQYLDILPEKWVKQNNSSTSSSS